MTTEEKAKAYDDALKVAQCWLNDPQTIQDCNYTIEDAIQNIFPQLRESEDERIRKWIIDEIKATHDYDSPTSRKCVDDALTYLEKQKEQKPIAESKRLANEVIEYLARCGYSPVLKDDSKKEHFHIDIPRHEDDFWHSEEYKHCRSVLGEYYMEGDYGATHTHYIFGGKRKSRSPQSGARRMRTH